MRKSVLIPVVALLAAVTMFASCKKDKKDELTGRKAQLVGTWVESFSASDLNDNNALDEDEKMDIAAEDAATVTYKSDGTGTFAGGSIEGDFKWDLSSDEQKVIVTIAGSSDETRIHTLTSTSFIEESAFDGDMSWAGYTKK